MDDPQPAIVLGVDFSPASERARDAAIRMAKQMRARVLLVHALKPLGSPGLDLGHPQYDPERNESADVTASNDLADVWLHRVRQQVPAEMVARPGRAADVLVEEAERVDARAIVVGSHGVTGLEHVLLGSVAEGVLKASSIPVIVVPGRSARERRPERPKGPKAKTRWLS